MIIYFLIIAAIAARFIPHMPNAAPITALAIFSAANLGWKKSVGLTLAVRFISDIFLGFFAWPLMVAVYASHLVGVLFGLWIKKSATNGVILKPNASEAEESQSKKEFLRPLGIFFGWAQDDAVVKWAKIIGSSLLSSAIFFLVTNFAFFYGSYSHNLIGIMAAYVNGLPFFRGTLFGDLGYTVALFGAYQFVLYAKSNKQRALAATT